MCVLVCAYVCVCREAPGVWGGLDGEREREPRRQEHDLQTGVAHRCVDCATPVTLASRLTFLRRECSGVKAGRATLKGQECVGVTAELGGRESVLWPFSPHTSSSPLLLSPIPTPLPPSHPAPHTRWNSGAEVRSAHTCWVRSLNTLPLHISRATQGDAGGCGDGGELNCYRRRSFIGCCLAF